MRRNFFSIRVIDNWNLINREKCKNSDEFQTQLQKPQKELGSYQIVEEGDWSQDGDVENNEMRAK